MLRYLWLTAGNIWSGGPGRVAQIPVVDPMPPPVITMPLLVRFRSRQEESFGAQVIAALRHEFGGHSVQTK